jgi:ribosomal silencing factor RsfS
LPTGFALATDYFVVTTTTNTFQLATAATAITSLDATANTLTKASHGMANGTVVRLTTTDTLPTGFALATDYYVVTTTTNTFQLETSVGNGAISFSGGTGTHSFQTAISFTGTGTGPHYFQSGVAMNRIIQQYDGRARVGFSVTGGNATSSTGTAASGTVVVNAGSEFAGNNILFLRVDNVDIITGTVAHTGSNNTTAAAIATAINAKTSVPNYTATAISTATVTITAADKGTTANGKAITSSTEGDFGLTNGTSPLAGGIDNAITNITMDGISIIRDPVLWETSHPVTAQKIADEINSTATSPEWEAVASGSVVTIIAETQGAATNNYYNSVTASFSSKTGDLATSVASATTSGGASIASGQQAGSFIYSNKYAIHSLEESTWRWCAVGDPTEWTGGVGGATINSAPGAGFQVLSNHARNSEELMAMSTYYENMAILAQDCIQIWYSDPDPALIQLVQVLNNTGTIAGKSVIAIGDSDVFYLARSGIRSLKSRDSSNAAYIGDIGNSIDSIIIGAVQADDADGHNACGILDPRSGRYYLAIGLKVYVFSYFPSSKVSAWSVYEPGFIIEDWAFDGRQVLCRSGDNVYSLGGINDNEYDSCKVTVQLPFLDASTPATDKMWSGIDLVSSSTWTIKVGGDPTDIEANELAATINKVTYGLGRVGLSTTSTHVALKLENEQAGAAKLGTLTVHYSLNEAG